MPASEHSGDSSQPGNGRSRGTSAPPPLPLKQRDADVNTPSHSLPQGLLREKPNPGLRTVCLLVNGIDGSSVAHVLAVLLF